MLTRAPLKALNVFCIKHLIKGLLRSHSILNIKRCTGEKVLGCRGRGIPNALATESRL